MAGYIGSGRTDSGYGRVMEVGKGEWTKVVEYRVRINKKKTCALCRRNATKCIVFELRMIFHGAS